MFWRVGKKQNKSEISNPLEIEAAKIPPKMEISFDGIKVMIFQAHLEDFDRALGVFLNDWANKPLKLDDAGDHTHLAEGAQDKNGRD